MGEDEAENAWKERAVKIARILVNRAPLKEAAARVVVDGETVGSGATGHCALYQWLGRIPPSVRGGTS